MIGFFVKETNGATSFTSGYRNCVQESETYLATGSEEETSDSVKFWACKRCYQDDSHGNVYGTAWFNTTTSTREVDQNPTVDASRIIQENADEDLGIEGINQVVAFVHGQFLSCTGISDQSRMNANQVRIIEPVGSEHTFSSSELSDGGYPEMISFVKIDDDKIQRTVEEGTLSSNTWSKSGKPAQITIDLDALANYYKANHQFYNTFTNSTEPVCRLESGKYKCTVGVYRCPNSAGATSDSGHKSTCGSDNETLTVTNVGVNGKLKLKQKINGEQTSIADLNFKNGLTLYQENIPENGEVSDPQMININGVIGTAFTYTLKLEEGKKAEFHINGKLLSLSSETVPYNYCNQSACQVDPLTVPVDKVNKSVTAPDENNGNKVWGVYAKVQGGKAMFSDELDEDNYKQLSDDMYCRRLDYRKFTTSGTDFYGTRQICIKIVAEASNDIQGRVIFKGANMEASADATAAGAQKTDWGGNMTQTVDPLITDVTNAKVYGQFSYYYKATAKDQAYTWKVVGCTTKELSNCRDKLLSLDSPTNLPSGIVETNAGSSNAKTKRQGVSDNGQEISNSREKQNGPADFDISSGQNLMVCRKLFVKLNSGQDSWNGSVGCINYSMVQDGALTAKSFLETVSVPSGCTVSGENSVSATASDPRQEASVNVTCGQAVSFKFRHTITGGGENTPSTAYKVYHRVGSGSGVKNPSGHTTANEPVDLNLTTNSNGVYSVQPSNDGSSTEVCESVWLDWNGTTLKTLVCARVTNVPIISEPSCPTGSYSSNTDHVNPDEDKGESYSISMVKSNVFTAWNKNGTIYAKPNDTIEFCHSYYPGAQTVRTAEDWKTIEEPAVSDPYGTESQGQTTGNALPAADIPSYTVLAKDVVPSTTRFVAPATSEEIEATYYNNGVPTNKYEVVTNYPASSWENYGLQYGSISMRYAGTGFNGSNVGTEGSADIGSAFTNPTVKISKDAVGGSLVQYVNSYHGTIERKLHESLTWTFNFNYYFDVCEKKENGQIDTDKCKQSYATNGKGKGSHVNNYYESKSNTITYGESSRATVEIPYNYKNSATVSIDSDGKIYAGEGFRVKDSQVKVNTRYNSTTQGDYATKAPNITVKLFAFATDRDISGNGSTGINSVNNGYGTIDGCGYYRGYAGGSYVGNYCTEIDSITPTFNSYGELTGTSGESVFTNKSYNAFDIPAGYYICVGIGFNPQQTADTYVNYFTTGYSAASCAKVYKKPTFAVWGGGIFSNGNISANVMEKRVLQNYYSYTPQSASRRRMFTSWAEGTIVANGRINNAASGAATGYSLAGNASTGYAPIAAPGGIHSGNHCDLARLTIANGGCSTDNAGMANVGNSQIRDEYLNKYVGPVRLQTGYADTSISLNRTQTNGSKKYTESGMTRTTHLTNGNVTITGGYGDYGITHIIVADGNVTITGNIDIPTSFSSGNQIPIYIIYAEGDIKISGAVTNIEAVLIAKGKIDTCAAGTGSCGKQLRINGMIVADEIVLNRTYGASVGAYSVEPAEIINYNTSINLWHNQTANEITNEGVTETYIRELPPRQ